MDKEQLKTSEKQDLTPIRNEKGQIISGTANPNGRPTGVENFATKWRRAVENIGKKNGMTHDEVEEQLLMVGYKKAKDGDYRFYQDVFDRIYGKAPQTINVDADIHTDDGITQEEKQALLNLLK